MGFGTTAPRPIGFGVSSPLCSTIKLASPLPLSTVCVAGILSILFILSPCHLTVVSRQSLLRRPSPLLGARITSSETPQLRPWTALNPTSIHTVVVASCSYSLAARSRLPRRRPGPHDDVDGMPGYPRRRLPAHALALKAAPLLPSSRPFEQIGPRSGHSCDLAIEQTVSARRGAALRP